MAECVMKGAYMPNALPNAYGNLDYTKFMDELIDATVALEVYMKKINDSKINRSWYLPMERVALYPHY